MHKTIIRCSIAMLVAASAAGCWMSSDSDEDKKGKSSQSQQAPDLKAEIMNAADLITWIKTKDKQTEMQRDESFAKLKNKYVVFKGNVRNVGQTAFGGKTYVSLRVDKLDMFENINVQFNVPESLKGAVSGWMKDEVRIMRGKITGTGDLEDDACCSDGSIVSEEQYAEAGGSTASGSKDIKSEISKEVDDALESIDKAADALKNL